MIALLLLLIPLDAGVGCERAGRMETPPGCSNALCAASLLCAANTKETGQLHTTTCNKTTHTQHAAPASTTPPHKQIPRVMELVGLGYTAFFAYRYLLFKESRADLARDVEALKNKITGGEL